MASGPRQQQPVRAGKMSDWQLYGRLLAYVLPYWWVFALSLLGYIVYSLGNVLLAGSASHHCAPV